MVKPVLLIIILSLNFIYSFLPLYPNFTSFYITKMSSMFIMLKNFNKDYIINWDTSNRITLSNIKLIYLLSFFI